MFLMSVNMITGIIVFLTGLVALVGYESGIIRLMSWDDTDNTMALPTSLCFMSLGLSKLAQAHYLHKKYIK